MSCFTFCVTLTLLVIIKEPKFSYQFGCPYMHSNGANNLGMKALTALQAKNTLAELGFNEHMSQDLNDLSILKPNREAGLLPAEIDSLIENSFQPNNIKKDGGVFGEEKFFDKYFGATKSAEFICAVPPVSCFNDSTNYYYRTYDGSCNNFDNPSYGMAKSRYTRLLRPKYGDGQYAPSKSLAGNALPNPRILSLSLYGEETLLENDRTLMSMQFGQFISHDLSEVLQENLPDDCCINSNPKRCYPITLHPYGPITMTTGKTCLDFVRGLSDKDIACPPSGLPYVEKISTPTSFLDLSSIYGNSLEQNIQIRLYRGGLLKTSSLNNNPFPPIKSTDCPANNEQCFAIPDDRNQFQPTATVLHTLFLREHNRLANILSHINPQYGDERIFQVARKINIAQFQKIIYYDWLPLILSPKFSFANRLVYSLSPYDYVNDYEPTLNPAPYAEHAAAAYRYLHHTVPGWFLMVSPSYTNQSLRLSDFFDRQESMPLLMNENNFDSLIRGLVTQLEKRADENIDREIKHHFNRKTFNEFGSDLKSIDIQRGRDFGLPSYNDLRLFCGLGRAHQWADFSNEISIEQIEMLKRYYDSPDDVELAVGGSFEKHVPDSILGPTFQCIIGKQFLKARIADRFFFENDDKRSGFTRAQLADIRKISLASILCANGNSLEYMQPNVFLPPNHQNNLVKCNTFPQLDLRLWKDNINY